jgi:hypothetical protein
VHYRDAETTIPATCRSTSSELHRAASTRLAYENEFMLLKTGNVKQIREYFD